MYYVFARDSDTGAHKRTKGGKGESKGETKRGSQRGKGESKGESKKRLPKEIRKPGGFRVGLLQNPIGALFSFG